MFTIKKIIFIVFLSSTFTFSWCQNSSDAIHNKRDSIFTYIAGSYHYGFIIPHNPNIIYWVEEYSHGLELNYGRTNFKQDNWSAYFNYPEIGLGFYYSTLGNNEVYGNVYAAYPYINFHLWRDKHFKLSYKVALGLGYADKVFDIHSNTENIVIGNAFNTYVGLGLIANYKLSKRLSARASLSINHFSNGATKKPNLGANIGSGSIGIKYHFNELNEPDIDKIKAPKIYKQELVAVIGIGQNQIYINDPYKNWSGTLNLQYLWHKSKKHAWGLGTDIMYIGGAPQLFNPEEILTKEYSKSDNLYGGIVGSYNVIMNRVTMTMQVGVYVLYSIKPTQPLYPRLGVRYNITDKLIANFSVKASFFTSEYLEFGLGYRFLN